ncbi:MAG: hypothetical protein ACON49_05015 [Candidatus Puniceispirillaceae bacterium]
MIISVTGLKTKGPLSTLRFWLLAIPAFRQARAAKGNLFCETRTVNGVQHTLTAWRSRKHMKHYVLSGAHRKAMGQFAKIATGATISFESDKLPSWEEAVSKWTKDAEWY